MWSCLKRCVEIILDTINDVKIMNELKAKSLLKLHKENTQGLWRELESKSVRCLILKFATNSVTTCQIAPMVEGGEKTEGLKPEFVNGRCLIFDGLKYQSTQQHPVFYMEL